MLTALNELSGKKDKPTANTARKITQFLNYCATYPEARIQYHASDMILYFHSDAGYLNCPKARSRAGGHFFISNKQLEPKKSPKGVQPNDPIHLECKVLTNVMSSVAEAEYRSCFHNGQNSAPMRVTLNEMVHPQPKTPIQVDNLCAAEIANN